MIIKRMSAKEARDNFSDLLGIVYYGKEPVIIDKKGRPYAVVINPDDYNRYRKAAKERFFETVDTIQADNKNEDPDQVLKDVTKAVKQVRQERYAKGQ